MAIFTSCLVSSDEAVAEGIRERKEQNKVIIRHLPNISYGEIMEMLILYLV